MGWTNPSESAIEQAMAVRLNWKGIQMKARVHIMLKNGVLDPQGEAIRHALGTIGFDGVNGVRQGKVIELDLATEDAAAAEAEVGKMCEALLANTVIESYSVELV